MGDEPYVEPNRKVQIIVLLIFVLVGAMVALLEPMIDRITPSQSAPLEELEAGARLLGLLALCACVIGFLVSLLWVAYFGRLGYRTLKLGSYPPPGTIVVFRTRVRTGKRAVLSGYLSISLAVLTGLFAVLMFYGIWLLRVAL